MDNQNNAIESAIARHLSLLPAALKDYMKRDYESHHMVIFEDLLPAHLKDEMAAEALDLLSKSAERREMIINQSGGTPRSYSSVGRNEIYNNGSIIPSFFNSNSILKFLSEIVGEELFKVPYSPEEYIINSQNRSGDTHGWHWDDYTFALVWVVEAPDVLNGGRVEFIPRVPWKKNDTRTWLKQVLEERPIQSRHIAAGQCYLLRASEALHRISPLTGDTRRTVIVFTYATASDLDNPEISHESMEAIYPADTHAFSPPVTA
jgi:hypothetical protein